jgi:two-component system cell cycle response regulator DivK
MPLALIVEDHATNRKLLRDILEIEFEVAEADSAEDALEVLKGQTPDLILMDLQLPGMDGLTLVRRLKEMPALQAIPIVAVSAHAMTNTMNEAREAGCVDYVTKPLVEDPYQFVRRLKDFLPHSEP